MRIRAAILGHDLAYKLAMPGRHMVLNSLGIITVLKPHFGYKQCAEIAREGHETGKSLHDIVVLERKLLTQERWDEIFSFENLINPAFEK